MVFINLALSVSVVFLMRYVQNLLNSDVKINLVEIVTQNKDYAVLPALQPAQG